MKNSFLKCPFFDDAHRNTASEFEKWVKTTLSRYEKGEGGYGRSAKEIYHLMGQSNWLQYSIEKDYLSYRKPFSLRTVCLLREILGYFSVLTDVAFSEPWLGILPIALFGSKEIKNDYLPKYLRGEILPSFSLSEPYAGSDVASIRTRAVLESGQYIISGRKTWISNAGLADLYIVFARTGEKPGMGGISALLVDGKLPGIVLEERIPVLSPHTVGTLLFDNVSIPSDHLIGKPGQGFSIAMAVLEAYRPTVAAAAVGLARRALDEALKRSLERVTFDKPISDHQLIQGKLAEMTVKVDASALLTYRAAWKHDVCKARITREASMAKLHATEMAQEVVDQAQQIFGGLGVVSGNTVERLYRHSRVYRIFDGTSEIQKLIIAKDALKKHRAEINPLSPSVTHDEKV